MDFFWMDDLVVMIAPNGARKGKADHPRLPITLPEIAAEAAACFALGAQALHLHVRDADGRHSLDPQLYLAATDAVRCSVGSKMVVQVTTEAVGKYSPDEQIAVVREVKPEAVSIAVKELIPDSAREAAATELYSWCREMKIGVQHIIYTPEEFRQFLDLSSRSVIPGERHSVIFPLGRYTSGQESDPAELLPFLRLVGDNGGSDRFDWFVCAFGSAETQALAIAAGLGGHCRIGFENSFANADGSVATGNAERLQDFDRALFANPRGRSGRNLTLRALGCP
jgi:uncharacterized protein (DUF849 family)